jgi:phospholipase/carboxylesterase
VANSTSAWILVATACCSCQPTQTPFDRAQGGPSRCRSSCCCTAPAEPAKAPDSRESTWDAVHVAFGPDVAFIDRALARVFETLAVDPARVAIGGFSDGATYALSLGLVNGDLFQRVVACSPGFLVSGLRVGKPLVFISHGTSDQILPIDRTSRTIVPGLRERGYEVRFHEFEGGHEVPPAIAREGVAWVKNSSSLPR